MSVTWSIYENTDNERVIVIYMYRYFKLFHRHTKMTKFKTCLVFTTFWWYSNVMWHHVFASLHSLYFSSLLLFISSSFFFRLHFIVHGLLKCIEIYNIHVLWSSKSEKYDKSIHLCTFVKSLILFQKIITNKKCVLVTRMSFYGVKSFEMSHVRFTLSFK